MKEVTSSSQLAGQRQENQEGKEEENGAWNNKSHAGK